MDLWEILNPWKESARSEHLACLFWYLEGFGADRNAVMDEARSACVSLAAALWARLQVRYPPSRSNTRLFILVHLSCHAPLPHHSPCLLHRRPLLSSLLSPTSSALPFLPYLSFPSPSLPSSPLSSLLSSCDHTSLHLSCQPYSPSLPSGLIFSSLFCSLCRPSALSSPLPSSALPCDFILDSLVLQVPQLAVPPLRRPSSGCSPQGATRRVLGCTSMLP